MQGKGKTLGEMVLVGVLCYDVVGEGSNDLEERDEEESLLAVGDCCS